MTEFAPYQSRAEHDHYKLLSAYDADEKAILAEVYLLMGRLHQISINRRQHNDSYFMENMKRRRASDKEK